MSTQKVVEFVSTTNFPDLPQKVVARARITIKDHLGVMLAAHRDAAVLAAADMALAMGGRTEATMVATGGLTSAGLAAMVNATMTTALDMDDGAYRRCGHLAHPGGGVIPGALAVAERQAASGQEFIEAVVIGYEVALRLGWTNALLGVDTTTGMAATYGVAAAAAKLLHLSTTETAHALGIAETHCAWPAIRVDYCHMTMTKGAAGWGAMAGVTAALLAQSGFTGLDTVFDLADAAAEPLAEIGRDWEIMNTYFKPYSSCRLSHAPIDGVLELIGAYHLRPHNIDKIKVAVTTPAQTWHSYRPADTTEAQFSIPFVVGAAIADGVVGPAQVSESRLADQEILRYADKVEITVDREAESLRPGTCAARVSIETRDGKELETFVPYPRGAPENPMTTAELELKFFDLVTRVMAIDRYRELNECLNNLADLPHVSQLTRLLSKLGAARAQKEL